jgi:hypothetical protein
LRKVLTEIDDGTYVAPRSVTVGEYLAEWLEFQRPHVAADSWVTARNHVAYYLAPDQEACAAYRARTGRERPSLGDHAAGLARCAGGGATLVAEPEAAQ